ncbi:PREDICTED: uncharacterized protein LOC105450849 [Wasmannia auropunctata]|uniref:uncharacterized protein LOC105450849 n=1 Tax=Wasmannia auropunctata TaxID=64793 RepID=UPI0005EE1C92|nr:PREDICTED: uncharacterized protein LOC105450849 [Wasmannia auropunctata]
MQEINDNISLEMQQEVDIICKQKEGQVKEGSLENNIQVIKDVKNPRSHEEINGRVMTFLHEKGLSENLIKTLIINTGLTDEHVRLLKTLNLSDDDIDNLQDLWQAKIEVNKSSDSINSTSSSSSSNDHHAQLSPNSIYLKKVLSKLLIRALCEIVAKKPADPVEYLGHWLLHYKICEERAMQQKESELERSLSIDREKLTLKKVEDEEAFFIERKDEEEYGEDRNYFDSGNL